MRLEQETNEHLTTVEVEPDEPAHTLEQELGRTTLATELDAEDLQREFEKHCVDRGD